MEEHLRNEALCKVLDSEGTNNVSVETGVEAGGNPAAALEGEFMVDDGAGRACQQVRQSLHRAYR